MFIAKIPNWSCQSCTKMNCFIHKAEVASCDCQERAQRDFLEEKTKKEKARTTKKCPKKGCGVPIEYGGDCARMTCRRPPGCGTQFCWACKTIFPGRTKQHVDTCRLGTITRVRKSELDTSLYCDGWDKDVGYDFNLDANLYIMPSDR